MADTFSTNEQWGAVRGKLNKFPGLVMSASDFSAFVAAGTDAAFSRSGDINGISVELFDGQRPKIDLGKLSRIFMSNGAVAPIKIYANALWISAVSSFTTTNAVDLVETGATGSNTANPINSVTVLNLPSAQTVKRGQLLKVISDDENVGTRRDSGSIMSRKGEFVMVALDSTGNTITLATTLRDTYTTNPRVFALPDCGVEFVGGKADYDDAITVGSNQPIIDLLGLRTVRLRDIDAMRSISRSIRAIGCYDVSVIGSSSRNGHNSPVDNNFGYGWDVTGCDSFRLIGAHGHHMRHLVTSNNLNNAANSTGLELHKYGRTRGLVVGSCTGRFGQNSPFDTHSDVDGAVFSNCYVAGGYAGGDSLGAGLTARGRNVVYSNCVVDGCLSGIVSYGQNNIQFNDVTVRNSRYFAVATGSDNISTNQDTELRLSGGRYEIVNPLNNTMVSLSAMSGQAHRVQMVNGVVFAPSGDCSNLISIIGIQTAGVELILDAVIDLRNVSAIGSCALIRMEQAVADSVKIRGKLKVYGGSVSLVQALSCYLATCAGDIELEIDYEGTNTFSGGGTSSPFGVTRSVFTAAKLKGRVVGTSADFFSNYIATSISPAGALAIGGNLEDEYTYAVAPTGDCTGSNAITFDLTNVKKGQRIKIYNNSAFTLQISSSPGVTLGPNGLATFLVPDYSGSAFLLLENVVNAAAGIVAKTASATMSSKDRYALITLNNAANTQTVTLHANAAVGSEIDFVQIGAGYWTFAAASGGSIVSLSSALKTGGQYTRCKATCIANSGGSAAQWLLTGTITV